MDIFGLIERAKKKTVERFKHQYMDVDFVLYEFTLDTTFQLYLTKLFSLCNLPNKALRLYLDTIGNYVVSYDSILDGMTSEEKTDFLKRKTKEFNEYILFLITQMKLLSDKDKMLAILITTEYFSDKTILGALLSEYKVTRDKIVDADQQIKLENLKKLVENGLNKKETLSEVLEDSETEKEPEEEMDKIKKYVTDYSAELKRVKPNKLIGRTRELELMEARSATHQKARIR